jgi:ubiquinone/menaquinone biosynthesis C-methylase UbiE
LRFCGGRQGFTSLPSPHTPHPTRIRGWQVGAYAPDLPAIFNTIKDSKRLKDDSIKNHQNNILDQFSRQARPFSQQPAHSQEAFLNLLLEMSGVGPEDNVLDVACGPGLVACAFAGRAKSVTGIDLTPAMIERAKQIQAGKGLTNLTWQIGNVLPLLFPDASFSLVVTRYTFHHFLDPRAVFAEMIRVCRLGGRVLVADVTTAPEKRDFFDVEETLRDPSHTRSLTTAEFLQMAEELQLQDIKTQFIKSERNLEAHLKASFPNPGDDEKIRKIFREDIGKDNLGLGAHWHGDQIHFAYPVIILVGRKGA